jgi:hypothetical protein
LLAHRRPKEACSRAKRTEELFAATALLDDLDEAGFELFDRGYMLSEDAHLARLGWDVDLDTERYPGSAVCSCIKPDAAFSEVGIVHIGGLVDGL